MRTFASFDNDSMEVVEQPGLGVSTLDDWGIVSHNGSETDDYTTSVNGVLILDGESTLNNEDRSQFSLPGSDSIPSDLGSLSEDQQVVHLVEDDVSTMFQSSVVLQKPKALLTLLVTVGASLAFGSIATTCYQRGSWKNVVAKNELLQMENKRIQESYARVLEEKEELELRGKESWLETDENGQVFTIADNCWLTAKGFVKTGDCGANARHASTNWIGTFVDQVVGDFQALFPPDDSEHDIGESEDKDQPRTKTHPLDSLDSFPLAVGEAIGELAGALASSTSHLKDALQESGAAAKDGIVHSSEAITGSFKAAADAMGEEMKDITKGSLNFIGSVVKDASMAANHGRKRILKKADTVSVNVGAMFEDSFSLFEYQTKEEKEK